MLDEKIIFMGTSSFAVPILEALNQNYNVIEVFTQPNKKVGRKQILQASAVKETALSLNLSVFQPVNLKDLSSLEHLRELNPDLIIVAAYGQILPREILTIPKKACLNVHASLLPKYRGASPIQGAILAGEKDTGVSIMLMDEGLDTGPLIQQSSLKITDNDTYLTLEAKLSHLGVDILIRVLESGDFSANAQDESKASLTKILEKQDGLLNFQEKTALELERQIRALSLWPQTFTFWKGKRLKILSATISDTREKAGTVYLDDNTLKIACKDGSLVPQELQLEGKGIVSVQEFLRGYPEFLTSKL